MEQLKFQDTESGETFEGFGRCLAESRIIGINNSQGKARLYKIENRLRTTAIPDYVLTAELGPDDLMVEQFNDAFNLASWGREIVKHDLESEDGDVLAYPLSRLLSDAATNDLDFREIQTNVLEYKQILQGKRKPKADPKPEPPAVPPVIKKQVDPAPFPWI